MRPLRVPSRTFCNRTLVSYPLTHGSGYCSVWSGFALAQTVNVQLIGKGSQVDLSIRHGRQAELGQQTGIVSRIHVAVPKLGEADGVEGAQHSRHRADRGILGA